ncbi:MAG: hypothetical protein LBR25_08330 [Erysipelotrichaceae bacterium]|jgi:hypothetical protein|nr:hypothetical protein [Erysipelotrichaceae bacterium]
MKNSLKLIGILIVGFGLCVGLFFLLATIFVQSMYVRGVASLFILAVILIAQFFTRKNLQLMIIVTFIAVIWGTFLDGWGNDLYNKPLEWLFSSQGKLLIGQYVYNYAPGEFSIINNLTLIKADGSEQSVSVFFLYLYRFFQYLIQYMISGHLIHYLWKRFFQKQEPLIIYTRDDNDPTLLKAVVADLSNQNPQKKE